MGESVEAHLAWILQRIGRTEVSETSLPASTGLALASDVHAKHDLPMWDAAAMDGYAVRAGELSDAETELRVVGSVAAGSAEDPAIPTRGAIRIMTGAPVPSDADTVIPVEATAPERTEDQWIRERIRIETPPNRGANIRRAGEDVRRGELVARAGEALTAARLSAIAAAGASTVSVFRRPRVAVLTTGSELQQLGEPLNRGMIPESNSLLVAGLLAEADFPPNVVEHFGDDPIAISTRIDELAGEYDAIITTGGIGPGAHDVMRIALADEPGIRPVHVDVRPGRPQCAGRHRRGAFIFALPGNPVSVAVSFELFVRPALRALGGYEHLHRLRVTATVAEGWPGRSGRLQVMPVRVEEVAEGLRCVPVVAANRLSHSVAAHGSRDGYALVEAERGDVIAGETVRIIEVGP